MGIQSIRYRASIVALVVAFAFSGLGVATAAPPEGKGPQPEIGCTVPGDMDVVLDPGHGDGDSGAYNETHDLYEKNLNLQIALIAADYLTGMGYDVALTRYGDTELGNSERGEIANACMAEVFVEIHLNGSSTPETNYSQTFWGKRRKDEDFAVRMAATLATHLPSVESHGTWQFANGGLLQADMPSTLVEAVFLTNNDEAAMLEQGLGITEAGYDIRQDAIAWAIATGIDSWFKSPPG